MTHPLTDDLCHQIAELWPPEDAAEYDNMRSAADWQLEQVIKWLDENISNYTDADYLGSCEHIDDLEEHLKKAMRPTQVASGREGALQALDRLCEENFDGLRRLAQEDS